MRKVKSLFFTLLALLYVTAANALIVNDKFTVDGITYQVTKMEPGGHDGIQREYNVQFCTTSKSGVVTIPSTVWDPNHQYEFTVTAIMNNSTAPAATSIVMPNTIKIIEANVFKGNNISTIEVPASVTTINDGAFSKMAALQSITVNASNPTFSSEGGVLFENKNGNKWIIGYPVAKPETEYTIPEGVYGVRASTFLSAGNLTKITLPASLKESPSTAEFSGYTSATSLREIAVAPGNTAFKSEDGVLLSADGKTLIAYPNAKQGQPSSKPSYQGTTTQPAASVYRMPNGVETVAQAAFAQVSGLTAIELNDVKKLEKGAFDKATKLRNVLLGTSVTDIQEGAFGGNNDLTAFDVESGNPNYMVDAGGVLYNKAGTDLVLFPSGKEGEYTTLPTTKTIKRRAFYYAAKVTKVNFNSNLEEIEGDAFQQTTSLRELAFEAPSKLKKIGTFAFTGSKIETLNLPASVETVDWSAFSSSGLKKVTVADGSQLKTIGKGAFTGCKNLEEFTFNGTTTLETIKADAFNGDSKLKSFTVPDKVTTLERGAFNGTSAMETVTFKEPASITTIGEGAFQGASALKRIELPETVTEIKKDAFNTCTSLQEIVIPKNVNHIDPTGFQECASLEKFTVDKDNATYSSVDGFLLSKDKKTLRAFPPAKANTYYTMLPPTIETIGAQAFYFVQNLENITIPEKVNKIEAFAFDRVAKLNTIAFLSKTPVTNIDPSAFNPANVDKSKIHISIRKDAETAYSSNPLWSQFPLHQTSFMAETNGTGNGYTEYFPLSSKAVMIVDTKADVYTYVVRPTVTNPTDGKSYQVRLWADYAMDKNNTNIKEVVFCNTLDYMGIDAFKKHDGSTTVESVFFTSAVPTRDMSSIKWELGDNIHEFSASQKIYVKPSAVAAYKAQWVKYTSQIDYKIKGVKIQKQYGTFAREFDSDLGIYYRENGNGDVAAYVAQISSPKPAQNGTTPVYRFKVNSIDLNGGASGDYSYVPAYTGVLIQSRNSFELPNDFYYAIGEKDNAPYTITGNIMTGVTEKATNIQSTYAAGNIDPLYTMSASKGYFMLVPAYDPALPVSASNKQFTMPVHKAYARPKNMVGATPSKVMIFDGNEDGVDADAAGTALEISNIEVKEAGNNVYYNLQGQRVEHPQHGIYIHNGKKVVLK